MATIEERVSELENSLSLLRVTAAQVAATAQALTQLEASDANIRASLSAIDTQVDSINTMLGVLMQKVNANIKKDTITSLDVANWTTLPADLTETIDRLATQVSLLIGAPIP